MGNLRSRAEKLLSGPHPLSRPVAAMIRLIGRFVAGEAWDDRELRDLLETAQSKVAEYEGRGPATGPAADALSFYRSAAEVLQGIQGEASARQV